IVWFCTLLFFFFQAEDGIRDSSVTGVQTCALPISRQKRTPPFSPTAPPPSATRCPRPHRTSRSRSRTPQETRCGPGRGPETKGRSEERRVGKEGRDRGGRQE